MLLTYIILRTPHGLQFINIGGHLRTLIFMFNNPKMFIILLHFHWLLSLSNLRQKITTSMRTLITKNVSFEEVLGKLHGGHPIFLFIQVSHTVVTHLDCLSIILRRSSSQRLLRSPIWTLISFSSSAVTLPSVIRSLPSLTTLPMLSWCFVSSNINSWKESTQIFQHGENRTILYTSIMIKSQGCLHEFIQLLMSDVWNRGRLLAKPLIRHSV